MTIDAKAAIKRLGIRNPVRFVFADLRQLAAMAVETEGVPEPSEGHNYFCPAAAHPAHPDIVLVDPDALRYCVSQGDDPAETIAHELVHVAQFQEMGGLNRKLVLDMLSEKAKGYEQNRYEREARELAPWLAPLIEVTL